VLLKERQPGLMVIDSFKALSAYADGLELRAFLHELAARLSALPLSSFSTSTWTSGSTSCSTRSSGRARSAS
jgi:hypothetical protein